MPRADERMRSEWACNLCRVEFPDVQALQHHWTETHTATEVPFERARARH